MLAAGGALAARLDSLLPCWLVLSLSGTLASAQPPGVAVLCPPLCHCEEDGIALSADCSELALASAPGGLSPLTAYLDLSMNNISELLPGDFHHLHFLEELRLSGNQLSKIPEGAFSGLYNLKILMLQNNQLTRIPAEALWDLPNLQSLRLDANLISVVPEKSFEGLPALRHLWLDDNALTEIPVKALNNLPALQAMTLALNRIWHIPDYAFQNLTSLVVLCSNMLSCSAHLGPEGATCLFIHRYWKETTSKYTLSNLEQVRGINCANKLYSH